MAQDLLDKHRVTSGGAASNRAAGWEIVENRWFFGRFSLAGIVAGGTPAPPASTRFPIRFPPELSMLSQEVHSPSVPCPRSGFHAFQCRKQLSEIAVMVWQSFFSLESLSPLSLLLPENGPKIFSNHWKTREKFFQSLEKSGHFFQPLEKYFPIIGKRPFPR
ncbi:MAG: hypothetical protein IKO01_09275 [Kiritimatiellae bacterium]|nr:hypothetical protein [Kiritimatiellia bacterium]